MILINFKTYSQSSGLNSVALAKAAEEVSIARSIPIIVCPQVVDLRLVIASVNIPVWVQHADIGERGRATGYLPLEIAKEAGAKGILLNHSEHKLPMQEVAETIRKAREMKLDTLVFVESVQEAMLVSSFRPNWIGYEPPELVASVDTSVAKSKPEVIQKIVKEVPSTQILVGAGVKDSNDVRVSLKLGAKGVAVASSIVLAANQKAAIEDLADGFK